MVQEGPYGQCRAAPSMQGRMVNESRMANTSRMVFAGPCGPCKAVRSMEPCGQCRIVKIEGCVVNAGPYGQCKAVWSMQGRMVNARPYGQCKVVWSMQGRMVNVGPYVPGPYGQSRAVWSIQGRMVKTSFASRRQARIATRAGAHTAGYTRQGPRRKGGDPPPLPIRPINYNQKLQTAPLEPRTPRSLHREC